MKEFGKRVGLKGVASLEAFFEFVVILEQVG